MKFDIIEDTCHLIGERNDNGNLMGNFRIWNERGKLIADHNYNYNGEKHGRHQDLYDNGNPLKDAYYKHDKLHGRWRVWTHEGVLTTDKTFTENNLHGKCRVWNHRGDITNISNYKNGKLHGKTQDWYDNGNLMCEMHFLEGIPHGQCRKWNSDGKLILNTVKTENESINLMDESIYELHDNEHIHIF